MIELIILKTTVIRKSDEITIAAFSNLFLLINMLGLTLCGKSNFEVIISTKAITAKKRLKSQKSKGNIMMPFAPFHLLQSVILFQFWIFLNKNLMKHD